MLDNATDNESVCSDMESDAERAADDETDLEGEDATPDDPLIVERGPAAAAGTHVIQSYENISPRVISRTGRRPVRLVAFNRRANTCVRLGPLGKWTRAENRLA